MGNKKVYTVRAKVKKKIEAQNKQLAEKMIRGICDKNDMEITDIVIRGYY